MKAATAYPPQLAPEDVEALLKDWVMLNADLMSLPLPAVLQLLEAEVSSGRRRVQVLVRLHGRFNRLRADEERGALMRGEMEWRR